MPFLRLFQEVCSLKLNMLRHGTACLLSAVVGLQDIKLNWNGLLSGCANALNSISRETRRAALAPQQQTHMFCFYLFSSSLSLTVLFFIEYLFVRLQKSRARTTLEVLFNFLEVGHEPKFDVRPNSKNVTLTTKSKWRDTLFARFIHLIFIEIYYTFISICKWFEMVRKYTQHDEYMHSILMSNYRSRA